MTVAIVGAKADACFMALGENLWDLRRLQSKIQAAGFFVSESYVSVTEVSEYAAGMPEEMPRRGCTQAAARGDERVLLLSDVQAPRGGAQLVPLELRRSARR